MNDYDLLRRYEPIIYYTNGELFFPCAVDEYLKRCSLWLRDRQGHLHELARVGQITAANLANYRDIPSKSTLYLRFVQEPLNPLAYQNWLQTERPYFSAPGRLARVGLMSRILDTFFDLSLLLRGSLPGGTTAAADILYRDIQRADPRYVYYGRVLREGGYIILHYLFFYPMNNWRSSFYGVNDHEADWEQIFIYLTDEGEADPTPRWVAYATHDFAGDDLRRRWDDPELPRFGDHPIVYAGAGSHASYFQPGEYLMIVEPAFLEPVRRAIRTLETWWFERLGGQGGLGRLEQQIANLLRIPFIDYARGDGGRIGPGQDRSWSAVLLTPDMDWAEHYRGLWGLDTGDIIGGERAPAGVKFNRDGSVRQSWCDPLGWVGLDKVTPPNMLIPQLTAKLAELEGERAGVETEIDRVRAALRSLGLEVEALQAFAHLDRYHAHQRRALAEMQATLQALHRRRVAIEETIEATRVYRDRIGQGNLGDPQAHIRSKFTPEPPVQDIGRVLEVWAALSVGLVLMGFIGLLTWNRSQWLAWAGLVGFLFLFVESLARRRLTRLLLNATIILAVVNAAILVIEFWWYLLVGGIVGLVFVIVRENLREIRRT